MAFIIERFIEENEEILQRSSDREMVFHCPRCVDGDRKGRFYVNRETLKYFCHKCHFAGGPLSERSEKIRLKPPALSEIRMPPGYVPIMPRPKELYHSLIRDKLLLRKYLKEKKLRWEDLQGWHLGYCTHGDFSDRLVLPVHFQNKLVAVQARNLSELGPKYKNVQSKGVFAQALYNWDRAKAFDEIVIVEGPFDAIRVGFNAVATMGTYLSGYRVDLLNTLHPKRIVLLFDSDAAGRAGAYKAYKKIFKTINVCSAILPKGKDPADMPREALSELIAGAQKVSLRQLFATS